MILKNLSEIKLQTIQHYDKVAVKYADLFKDEICKKEYDRKLLDGFAQSFNEKSLLCDAGCGAAGQIGRYLFDKGLNVCGIDFSEVSIKTAREVNPGMVFHVMDMTKLDFPDDSLDGIVAFYAIIHVPKKHMGLIFSEFSRVLKKGGKLFLAVHKGESESVVEEALGQKTSLHISYFNETEIIQYLTYGGFNFEFMETRDPYDFEFHTQRIYAQAIKK
jgi:ubiquinone/menaquinone biosynthesis C-methylase UbiE